ncbi:alpha/beta hydrolase [Sphingomonas oligophenolica]|uniref:Alpha/beta hydrolase n=1 Tax=Sphingomonas oligophenolica TaxID=301154 RepID=A0ABU9YAW5_9SPHN
MTKTRMAARALLIALLGVGCVLAVGAAYNALSLRHYRSTAGVPGKLFTVDRYKMHLFCTGHGGPAIILDAGLGDDSLIWAKVQPELSQHTTVCAYDRAGFGWSEPRPGRRDANSIADQLHGLLRTAQIAPPYIMMGHSISGLYLRAYANRYSSDLAGLVFVDGATPLQDDRIPKALVAIQDEQRRDMPWDRFLVAVGWYRAKGACTQILPGFEHYTAWIKADSCVPSQITAVEAELDSERLSGEETLHAGPFANLPILILSRDPAVLPSNWPKDVGKANATIWNRMQEEAKSLSPHSRRIIAKGSDHYIQIDRPDLLNKEVLAFMTDIQKKDFSRLDGTTTFQ